MVMEKITPKQDVVSIFSDKAPVLPDSPPAHLGEQAVSVALPEGFTEVVSVFGPSTYVESDGVLHVLPPTE